MTSRTVTPFFLRWTILLMTLLAGCGSRSSHTQMTSAAHVSARPVCVQTFNAYGPAYAPNISGRTNAWGQALALNPCSIIQAQEVWSEQHYEQAIKSLSKSLPFMSAVRFDNTQHPYEGQSGLALFTNDLVSETSFERFEVNQDGVFDDIRTALGVIKGMGSSHLTLREQNQDINVIDLHTHPSSIAVRLNQVTQLLRKFDRMLPLEHPLIISGDFNFEPGSVEYRLLRDVMLMRDSYAEANGPYTGAECTYCVANPHHWDGDDRVIDYIWSRNSMDVILDARQSWINLRGINGIVPSDHYGLRTLFEVHAAEADPVDHQTIERRRLLAMSALDAALRALSDESTEAQDMALAFMTLRGLKQRLTQNNPSDQFVLQLAVP